MSIPKCFELMTVGSLQLASRIVIAPMCQYSALAGRKASTDEPWHGGGTALD